MSDLHSDNGNDSQSGEELRTSGSLNNCPAFSVAVPEPPKPSTKSSSTSMGEKWKPALVAGNVSKEDLETIIKEISIQENILLSLQKENEGLLLDKKQLKQKVKELEERNANLEAKHSIQMSMKDFSSSTPEYEKDNTIRSLRQTIEELKSSIEDAEKIKVSMQSQIQKQKTAVQTESSSMELKPSQTQPSLSSQAHQYRLVESLKEKIDAQKSEIELLRERYNSLQREQNEREQNEREQRINGRENCTCRCTNSVEPHGWKENTIRSEEFHIQVEQLKLRIRQLEGALLEKDRFAEIAVEKMKTESLKIKTYYENAIKSIISNQNNGIHDKGIACEDQSESASQIKVLRAKISELEEKLGNCVPEKKYSEVLTRLDSLTQDLLVAKNQIDSLLIKLQAKNEEMDNIRTASKDELISRLDSMRQQHNSEITRLQEQHQREIKRLFSARINKDFSEKLKKQWRRLQEEQPENFLTSVIDRLTFLEKYCAQKDVEMEVNISQILRVSEMENKVEKQKAEMIIEQKNIQIQEFQYHLDSLMRTVKFLKANN